uniref:Uncharacterized protein n=1 Tax=Nelumbo nucifera TaxID=4432 RepID=A0A822Z597_NELNU|nr:TPA_asm: hypothetical protein HUJ06_007339 [Nelumbo nucifera]
MWMQQHRRVLDALRSGFNFGNLGMHEIGKHARGFITDIWHSDCWCSIDYCS